MKQLTALEKTIWNLAMTGGSVMLTEDKREDFESEDYYDEEKFKKGAIWQVCGFAPSDLMIPLGEGCFEGWLFRNGNTYVNFKRGYKPILHSLSKLTEPVLEGGKVPIVELFKTCMQNNYLPSDFFKKEKPIFYIEDDAVNLKIGAFTFGFDLLDNSFVLVLEDNILTVFNQKQLFDQLRQWGFNIENLNPDEYEEKSTLKT